MPHPDRILRVSTYPTLAFCEWAQRRRMIPTVAVGTRSFPFHARIKRDGRKTTGEKKDLPHGFEPPYSVMEIEQLPRDLRTNEAYHPWILPG
jgi:hypothetical protein